MKKLEIVIRPEKLEPLKSILTKYEYSGFTVMSAMGAGNQKGNYEEFQKLGIEINLLPKLYVMTVVWDEDLDSILAEIVDKLSTNTVGDGVQLTASGTKCVTITEQEAAPEETGDTQEATTEETTEEAVSGSWQQTDGNWWYQNADGTYPTSCWQEIDGQWYVFDENGYIRTGWYQEGDKWYYFQENGAMAHDTDVDGYHLGSDGVMQ